MISNNALLPDEGVLSYENYKFDLTSRVWILSRDVTVNIEWVDELFNEPLRRGAIQALVHFARTYSAHHAKNMSFYLKQFSCFVYKSHGELSYISSSMLISYRSTLDRHTEYYLGALSGFIKQWHDIGFAGIDNDVPSLLDGWTFKGNVKGRAVNIKDVHKGPLTDIEFEALHQKALDAFEKDEIELEEFVLVVLFMATGRRPSQLADLKVTDFISVKSTDGLQEFLLNIPRRKQKGVPWRGEFKAVALIPEIGLALQGLISKSEDRIRGLLPDISQIDLASLPVFPLWKDLMEFSKATTSDFSSIFHHDDFHETTHHLRQRLNGSVKSLSIQSERTGEPLHIFPTRLRRTLGSRAAREGYGSLVIAELLDHNDTQNVNVYTENVPENVDAINEAVARQIAPLVQAFAGVLVDREQDALRGDDPKSRVRTDHGNGTGTCGLHGFCGALAPIACYTCKNFQPWIDGPHEEVLQGLLAERNRISEITREPVLAMVNDRTIFAVTEVIQRCEARRAEMSGHV